MVPQRLLGTRQGLQKLALLNLVLYGWSARLNPLVLAKLVEQFGHFALRHVSWTACEEMRRAWLHFCIHLLANQSRALLYGCLRLRQHFSGIQIFPVFFIGRRNALLGRQNGRLARLGKQFMYILGWPSWS